MGKSSVGEISEGLYRMVAKVTTSCDKLALKTIIVFLLRFLAVALIAMDSPRQYPPLCIPTEIDPEDLKNERINFCSGVFMLIIS